MGGLNLLAAGAMAGNYSIICNRKNPFSPPLEEMQNVRVLFPLFLEGLLFDSDVV